MRKLASSSIPVMLFVLLLFLSYYFFRNESIIRTLETFVGDGSPGSVAAYVLILVLATIIAPVSAVPLMPLAAHLFGPFATSLWSVVGWWVGAIIAFVIARYFSDTVLVRLVSKEKMEKYKGLIPAKYQFGTVVLLRLMTPVDFLSYVLGLFTNIPLRTYALATLIGITPFAFVYSYGGEALFSGNWKVLAFIVLGGVALLAVAWYIYKRLRP